MPHIIVKMHPGRSEQQKAQPARRRRATDRPPEFKVAVLLGNGAIRT